MKNLLLFIPVYLLLPFFTFSQSTEIKHPIETRMKNCLDTNLTTSGMNNCLYKAMTEWDAEIKKYYSMLEDTISEKEFEKLRISQTAWTNFKDLEFETLSSIYTNKQGTMWTNILSSDMLEIIKTRASDLRNLYEMYIIE